MSKHLPKVVLIDLLDAIDTVLLYTADIEFETYLADRKTRDATYRNIEVMGEAVRRLPESYLNDHSEIPWNKIIASRNALIHGYDQIDDKIVWNIAKHILPALRLQILQLIE